MHMTLKEFLDMYDNWNGNIVVNDNNLNPVVRSKIFILTYRSLPNLMNKEVIAFGFYDDELAVRLREVYPEGAWDFEQMARLNAVYMCGEG